MSIKHRKYRLVGIFEHKSTVQNINTNEVFNCFYINNHKLGDEFYLYIKDVNIFTGNPIFEYSVKNNYKENQTYQFSIIDKKGEYINLSNQNGHKFNIPARLTGGIEEGEIELKVRELNLDQNKLIFYSPNDYDEINPKDFEEGEEYTFKIKGDFFNKNNTRFAIINLDDKTYITNLPFALNEIELDKEIPFIFKYYKDNNSDILTPTFNVSIKYTSRKLFEIGKQYSFKIEQIISDSDYGDDYWVLRDSVHNFKYNYHPHNDYTIDKIELDKKEGDIINLFVDGYSKNGFLLLNYKINYAKSVNYLVEDLFDVIGYPDQENIYFFNEELKLKIIEGDDIEEQDYIDQYNEGENLWVFSYLKFLDVEIYNQLEEGDIERAKTLVDIYIKVEDWILNKSDYLKIFNNEETRTSIIYKAKSKLKKFRSLYEAIDLFLKNEDENFIENSIRNRINLFIDDELLHTFGAVVNLNSYFNNTDFEIYEIVFELFNKKHLKEEDLFFYIRNLERDKKQIQHKVISNLEDIDDIESNKDLLNLIQGQYILLILSNYDEIEIKKIINSVNLLRFLAIFHDDVRFVDLAINLLVNRRYLDIKIPRGKTLKVIEQNFEYFSDCVSDSQLEELIYNESGQICLEDNGLSFTPGHHNSILDRNKNTISKLNDFNISITSNFLQLEVTTDENTVDLLRNIYEVINYDSESISEGNNYIINPNKTHIGQVKDSIKPTYFFIKFLRNNKEEESLFHLTKMKRTRLPFDSNLTNVLKEGDLVQFQIELAIPLK